MYFTTLGLISDFSHKYCSWFAVIQVIFIIYTILFGEFMFFLFCYVSFSPEDRFQVPKHRGTFFINQWKESVRNNFRNNILFWLLILNFVYTDQLLNKLPFSRYVVTILKLLKMWNPNLIPNWPSTSIMHMISIKSVFQVVLRFASLNKNYIQANRLKSKHT